MVAIVAMAFMIQFSSGCKPEHPEHQSDVPAESDAPGFWFEESANGMGLAFRHVAFDKQRFYFPEIMPGGIGLLDFDNDGDLDIYFVQSGDLLDSDRPGNELYRNEGNGRFSNVTPSAGVGDQGYGMGCTCADYDGDGDTDIYVTNLGPNVLYRNNGDGSFTNVASEAGVASDQWGTSCAFADYDRDGDLDLFVVNYVNWSESRELPCRSPDNSRDYCMPTNYNAPASDQLYRNNGNGTFSEISDEVGLKKSFGYGLGVATADFDGDGHLDFYVANDATPNQLWLRKSDNTLTDRALLHGCALSGTGAAEAGMGVMAVDVESDGDVDLFMSHIRDEANRFYLNEGGLFDDASAKLGLTTPSLASTGFGLGFADFDHDGQLDLFVANGRVTLHEPLEDRDHPYAETNLLFKGSNDLRFSEVLPKGGTETPLVESSRGAAFGDIDNDGDVDIVVINFDAQVHVLRNIAANENHWIMFRVLDRKGVDALGASVRIQTGGRHQWRDVQVAYSYCASNDPRIHFGLGNASQVDAALVKWPDGTQESFASLAANRLHTLKKGDGQAP